LRINKFSAFFSSAALVKLKLPVITICFINDNNFIMGYGVGGVYKYRNALIFKECI